MSARIPLAMHSNSRHEYERQVSGRTAALLASRLDISYSPLDSSQPQLLASSGLAARDHTRPILHRLISHAHLSTLVLAATLVAATSFVAGCSSNKPVHRWNDRVLEAGSIADRGDVAEAQSRYARLLESAPGTEERRYVLVELGRMAEAQDNWREALDLYERLWSSDVDDEYGARALYRTSVIQQEQLGEPAKARESKRRTIFQYPRSVSAEFAVRDLADYYSERGALDEMARDFRHLYDQVAGEAIGDNIMFELGRALEVSGQRDDDALAAYREVVRTYDDDSLADDALWQMAKIYRRHQMWRPAIAALELAADKMEVSWFIGDYNSPWANDARFQLGIINLLFLDQYERAIEHFEQYLEDFPHSLYADDAAWHIVEAQRLAERGDRYRDALRDFLDDFPESRHVRTAKNRLGISEDESR